MTDYIHLTALDDETRPARRVWHCPATDVYAKTFATPLDLGFGRLAWRITGSACDADGHGAAESILPEQFARLFQIEPFSQVADIAAALDAEIRFVVALVENAVLNERQIQAATPPEEPGIE